MPRDASLEPLDERRGVADFRFCTSLAELRGRLDRITPDGPPTFVWSLPQDIHVAVLNREGTDGLDAAGYDGFHAPYAVARPPLRRLLRRVHRRPEGARSLRRQHHRAHLRPRRLARRGGPLRSRLHASTPRCCRCRWSCTCRRRSRQRFDSAPDALAFTTDITPTLHALLGHEVRPPSPIFGRPLVWPRGTRPPAAPPFGLVASSYGTVYGWIDGGGPQPLHRRRRGDARLRLSARRLGRRHRRERHRAGPRRRSARHPRRHHGDCRRLPVHAAVGRLF